MTNTPKEVQPEGLFDDAEVIDVYTDADAIEDGTLVPVVWPGGVNRVTRPVFDYFVKYIGDPRNDIMDLTPLMAAIDFMLAITPDDGWRTGKYQGKKLWLIPNEVAGMTLMFPEDLLSREKPRAAMPAFFLARLCESGTSWPRPARLTKIL